MTRRPLTGAADPTRPMPDSPTARHDAAERALGSLRDELRRLERLGLEEPLARGHHQMRFWQFVAGMTALQSGEFPTDGAAE